ncbi:MAG: methyltransferase domain-containing protein [Actinomycetota bacterium]|nr:methyltransferase domain-containing protein [Actinomycetota bacterium]
MNICTIVAKNYVAHARTLAKSYKDHYPEGKCYVLVVDETEGYINPSEEPFELVRPTDIGLDDFEHMISIYDVVEFSTAVKPWFLAHLMKDRGEERIVYFDPDIQIFDRMDGMEGFIKEKELVLIPHVTSPMPRDGEKPSEADIMIAGTYNLGFIALENTERSLALLDWWAERLATDCIVAPELGYFVDQRWIDFAHGVMPGFHVLTDPGYNVAYWNLHGREVKEKSGEFLVNGEPLKFFHFSGFSPDDRGSLSKHQSRIKFKRGSALSKLCDSYADSLLRNGFETARGWTYTYSVLPNGVKLDSGMHRIYREGLKEGVFEGGIFTKEGADRFVSWLNEPAKAGGEHGVTRYLYEIYEGRPDLRSAFPSLEGPDAADLLEWAETHGGLEIPLKKHPALEENGNIQRLGASIGMNVAGYFRSELGVGEVARQMTEAAQTQGIPVATVGIETPHSRQGHDYTTDSVSPAHPVNLICVNADALPDFAAHAGLELFQNRYSVGMWWWEVSEFPARFDKAFDYVDEVWVGSHHVADAVSRVSPIPVVKMTVPLAMPEIKKMSRSELGLPEGFLFLFSFDYHSVFERKNPLAAVEAFKKAFPNGGSGASLVVKSINGEHYPEKAAMLEEAASEHPDIHIVDRYVSFDEKNAMAAGCDCYVSLHRSEGFGFTMAEPMHLGKPVIATAYSGNLDFMTDRNSYLVDYRLVPIGEGAEPYPASGEWAEPDVDHASRLMRRVFDDKDEAKERGRRASEDIRRTHSPEAAGKAMAGRLSSIEAKMRRKSSEEGESSGDGRVRKISTKPLHDRIMYTPELATGPGMKGKAISFARRALLKFEWPFAMQQRTVNDQLLTLVKVTDRNLRDASHHIHGQLAKVREFISEARATPYMSGEPFETYHEPLAGTVQGFESANGASTSAGRYDAFEDIFRGSEDFIRDRQRRYIPILERRGPVLDVGCGRGEFLDLLRHNGIEYAGIDLDEGMVERCRRKGHQNVEVVDANSFLEKQADGSIGVVFSAQVIEHMPYEELLRFYELAERKLAPGGVFIAETVNPHSVAAMKSFWVDPTHEHPVFPEVTLALAKIHGFRKAYVFHPNGSGDIEDDRHKAGEYAMVARKAETK